MGCTLEEAYNMTWAEFCIRSFGFNRVREYEMKMVREVAYEVFTLKYLFGKNKPPRKEKFWPISEEDQGGGRIDPEVNQEMMESFQKAWEEYEAKRKKNE